MKKHSRNLMLLILAATLIAAILIFHAATVVSSAEKKTAEKPVKHYVSYEVQKGDTLWSIADQNCREYGMPKDDYIRDIKKINGLESNTIRSGNYLIVIKYRTAEN